MTASQSDRVHTLARTDRQRIQAVATRARLDREMHERIAADELTKLADATREGQR